MSAASGARRKRKFFRFKEWVMANERIILMNACASSYETGN